MRAFEFHAIELEDARIKTLFVDLDSVVSLQKWVSEEGHDDERTHWIVNLSSGDHLFVTKPAFDRIMLAWNTT